jgi:hypothetical protein
MERDSKRCFLRIVRAVAVLLLWLVVKRNSIVLNDIGNVFLTRTVHAHEKLNQTSQQSLDICFEYVSSYQQEIHITVLISDKA